MLSVFDMKSCISKKFILTSIDDIKTVVGNVLNDVETITVLSDARRYEIKLVINELLTNCFRHAEPSAERPVVLYAQVQDGNLGIRVTDQGEGFAYEKSISNLEESGSEERLYRERGRGLMLVRAFCNEIKYNCRGNSVEVKIVL